MFWRELYLASGQVRMIIAQNKQNAKTTTSSNVSTWTENEVEVFLHCSSFEND